MPPVIKVLLISYKFTNKLVSSKNLGQEIKNYYESNSRNKIDIALTKVTYAVPFTSSNVKPAVSYVKRIMPRGFSVYIHFCNPKVSNTGGGNIVTFASRTNSIHEFGHFMGLQHASTSFGKLVQSTDPFDQMTSYAPYPSTNSVHRYIKNWFLENELVTVTEGPTTSWPMTFRLGMLKNFVDKTSTKVVLYQFPEAGASGGFRRFFISYGTNKGTNCLVVHTVYGSVHSILIGIYRKLAEGSMLKNEKSGLTFKILGSSDNFINFEMSKTSGARMASAGPAGPEPVMADICDSAEMYDDDDFDGLDDLDEDTETPEVPTVPTVPKKSMISKLKTMFKK
jgi:hypothetical protein